jgi:hypothetical protein
MVCGFQIRTVSIVFKLKLFQRFGNLKSIVLIEIKQPQTTNHKQQTTINGILLIVLPPNSRNEYVWSI